MKRSRFNEDQIIAEEKLQVRKLGGRKFTGGSQVFGPAYGKMITTTISRIPR
jgi:hypothetical protein